jgi:prepilin-type N-terminal cleavage/methylation domain-containing protein/prepilin-type processing-associated H-X9-DG protein
MGIVRQTPVRRRVSGFTLVELLIVMAIIATLISILLPVINGAQKTARALQCASNIKQITTALINYSANSKGQFPQYVTFPYNSIWYNDDVIGRYLPNRTPVRVGPPAIGGPVFTCPEDDRSVRSYAMNLWMTSRTSDANALPPTPKGQLWRSAVYRRPTQIILVTERWSIQTGPGIPATYFMAAPMVGGDGDKPGKRFGMAGGVPSTSTHWGAVACELPYMWHHRSGDGPKGKNAYGRINIGYVDGHVDMKTADQLADRNTGLSRLDSWWSPWDEQQNTP